MEQVVERGNVLAALRRVKRNQGNPGIDGMTVEELPGYLREHWPRIREGLLAETYRPSPVKRVEIPKPGGGVRNLGIPTALDRFMQQAVLQVRQPKRDPTFSDGSYGFRPGRSAHQVVGQAQRYLGEGYDWGVDLDLEKFFDAIGHHLLRRVLKKRIQDQHLLDLITRLLRCGVCEEGRVSYPPTETAQGAVVSPLLAHVLLHEFDDWSGRTYRVRPEWVHLAPSSRQYRRKQEIGGTLILTRDADDWVAVWKGSRTRAEEIKAEIKTCLANALKLRSTVPHPGGKELDSWIRRRLRCYLWKQWGRRRYRELHRRGVSRDLARNTVKSAHGPWRLSHSPALAIALPGRSFDGVGVPRLYRSSRR